MREREIVDKLTSAFFAENTIISFTSQLDEALTRKLRRMQRRIEEVKERFVNLNRLFQELVGDFQAKSDQLVSVIQDMEKISENIMEELKKSGTNVDQIVERVKEASSQIGETLENIRSIEKLIQNIMRIARETNILALNATIEAARAGEAGKGFMIVANEVQNLSNETNEVTKQIVEKAREILESSQRSLENLEFMANLFETVGKTLQNMVRFMENNVKLLQEVRNSLDTSKESLSEKSAEIDGATKVLEETAGGFTIINRVINSVITAQRKLKDLKI
ncbi:methyl-accepting chemotaxis sensory transducer [Thermotoga petrophila RKU-10]|uniref:Methyl-accepting chemotaxis sensory transducer n=1 Tax=Thermotoga petrophila (strain ATCC BAA-489 / DSM 13996 / JCM 10882 / RKU-10) TaxID=590168 RepID=D2C705_THEP2|nr:methyl-accepting chemotaxis protein [Thermotoga petrophila]ADA66741.1 methyl-accepting chemotaxis sensory transducer [Thermotoga petrophila RKU-10]